MAENNDDAIRQELQAFYTQEKEKEAGFVAIEHTNEYADVVRNINNVRSSAIASAGKIDIDIRDLEVREQVRKDFNDEDLKDLASSIEEHGLLSPITVIQQDNGKYLLVCGERRLRACKSLNMTKITANIIKLKKSDYDYDSQISIIQIVENLQRSNPSLDEYISVITKLRSIYPNLTAEQIAKVLGKTNRYAQTLLRASELSRNEQEIIFPLGMMTLNKVYLPLKSSFEKEAMYFIKKSKKYMIDKTFTPDVIRKLQLSLNKLYAKCKGEYTQNEEMLGEKETKNTKKKKFSVSIASLNKSEEDLGDWLNEYIESHETDLETTVLEAIKCFLKENA